TRVRARLVASAANEKADAHATAAIGGVDEALRAVAAGRGIVTKTPSATHGYTTTIGIRRARASYDAGRQRRRARHAPHSHAVHAFHAVHSAAVPFATAIAVARATQVTGTRTTGE